MYVFLGDAVWLKSLSNVNVLLKLSAQRVRSSALRVTSVTGSVKTVMRTRVSHCGVTRGFIRYVALLCA